MTTGLRELVIVGAGPSGLTAAFEGRRNGIDTLLIDASTSIGGQAKGLPRIEDYPGFVIGISGQRLSENMYEQVQRVGAEAKLGLRVTGLSYEPESGLKTLTFSDGQKIQAKCVVIAVGVEFTKLDFPGFDSPHVIYGDVERLGKEAAGKTVVLLGSTWATKAALGLAWTAKDVYLVSRSLIDKGISDRRMVDHDPRIHLIENDEAIEFTVDQAGDGRSLTLRSGTRLNADVVGVLFGGAPDLSWLPPQIDRDRGRVTVDSELETAVPGVFAVGDARSGGAAVIVAAVADGQRAALKCVSILRPDGALRDWS